MAIRVTVVYAPAPRTVHEVVLQLGHGATVDQALAASALTTTFPALCNAPLRVGVWGNEVAGDRTLHDHDRVEVYRMLAVDPKVARRKRFATQGARSAGLFAHKRPGAKSGY